MSLIPHHTSDSICPLCEQKLLSAHSTLVEWYKNKIKPKFPDSHISWSFRNEQEQEQAYLDHTTLAHWPKSKHNHTNPNGDPQSLALDIFEINDQGHAQWSPKFFSEINEFIISEKDPIIWGGNFKSISDHDHFEIE